MNIFEKQNSFIEKGFIQLEKAFDSNELRAINNEYNCLIEQAQAILLYTYKNKISLGECYSQNYNKLIVVPELQNSLKICRFEYISSCSKILQNIVTTKLQNIISEVMQEPFILFKDKCNVKEAGGGAFPPHQDIIAYSKFKPKFHITAALIIDNSNIENGCLEMATNYNEIKVPDNKIFRAYNRDFPILDFTKDGKNNGNISSSISQKLNWLPIESQAGNVILFNSYIPHRSKKNKSLKQRRNLFFTFNHFSDGDFYQKYYKTKRENFNNPIFHIATPTNHSSTTS